MRKVSTGRYLREIEINSQRSIWLISQPSNHLEGIRQLIILRLDLSCIAPASTEWEQEMEHVYGFAVLGFRYFVLDRRRDIHKTTEYGLT